MKRFRELFRKPAPLPLPLDEPSLRRPDFTTGHRARAVELGNGQSWMIPKPVIELRLGVGSDGTLDGFSEVPTFGDGGTKTFGTEYLDLIAEATRAEGSFVMLNATGKVIAFLLRQNYRLDNDQIQRLLPRVIDDEPNNQMWNELAEVVAGVGPKLEADGIVSSD